MNFHNLSHASKLELSYLITEMDEVSWEFLHEFVTKDMVADIFALAARFAKDFQDSAQKASQVVQDLKDIADDMAPVLGPKFNYFALFVWEIVADEVGLTLGQTPFSFDPAAYTFTGRLKICLLCKQELEAFIEEIVREAIDALIFVSAQRAYEAAVKRDCSE